MAPKIENLALQIAGLKEDEQPGLWTCVADLLFRCGLRDLSERCRQRLRREGGIRVLI